MWGVVAVWMVCLASLSLPWPGAILVVLLCCVALFELASPKTWIGLRNRDTRISHTPIGQMTDELRDDHGAGDDPDSGGVTLSARRWSPSSSLLAAFDFFANLVRLGDRGGGKGGLEEIGMALGHGVGAGGESISVTNFTPAAGGDGAVSAAAPHSAVVGRGRKQHKISSRSLEVKAARPPATFLKGSVGSFSRGGLMVTYDGRVIYKINQDRGLISHPSLNRARHTVFGVFDGHGENGELVAAYMMREVTRRIEHHPDAIRDPASALQDVFMDINSSLPKSGINAVFGGCTAVVALIRGPRVWVANAGDSRALVAGRGRDGVVVARGLTRDQNPDSEGERERIETMGGFISDPEEPGASARVWLDSTKTLVGLAMARSIGDLAVKKVGVIAMPEVTEYVLTPRDEFLVLASDGVWEFIDNQEAAEVVQGFFDRGEDAAGACKGLMELANRRWSDMVGDYRDDITATVVRVPFLPPAAAAEALAMNASAAEERDAVAVGGVAVEDDQAAAASAGSTTNASPGAPAERGGLSSGESTDSAVDGQNVANLGSVNAVRSGSPDIPPATTTAIDSVALGGGGVGNDASGPNLSGVGAVLGTATEKDGYEREAKVGNEAVSSERGVGDSIGVSGESGAAGLASTPAVTPESASEEEEEEDGERDRDGEGVVRFLAEGTKSGAEGTSSAAAGAQTPAPAFLPAKSTEGTTGAEEESGQETSGGDDARSEGDESGEGQDWEWDFGARENREPSREMREASREFPSGSLNALAAGEVDVSLPRRG